MLAAQDGVEQYTLSPTADMLAAAILVAQSAERMVGRQEAMREWFTRERTRALALEPLFDRTALITVPVRSHDGVVHNLCRDRAEDLRWNRLDAGGRRYCSPSGRTAAAAASARRSLGPTARRHVRNVGSVALVLHLVID